MTILIPDSTEISYFSTYDQIMGATKDILWKKLGDYSVGEWLEIWLKTLSNYTAINYRTTMKKLAKHELIYPDLSLQAFALINHDAVVDKIKMDSFPDEKWSECTRQARAACYISFTGFLSRRFQGMIKKANPNKEGSGKTFYRVHQKVISKAMAQAQWLAFLGELLTINYRDCLIAKIALQGGKRIGEVLSLSSDQIDWKECQITFSQSKTKGTRKETVITYPTVMIEDLHRYLQGRDGLVFTTRTGKKVPRIQLASTFAKAGRRANIPFKVTPHTLRCSNVTFLKQQGFADSEVMKVTGHASAEMIYAYDKSCLALNASKKVSLFS